MGLHALCFIVELPLSAGVWLAFQRQDGHWKVAEAPARVCCGVWSFPTCTHCLLTGTRVLQHPHQGGDPQSPRDPEKPPQREGREGGRYQSQAGEHHPNPICPTGTLNWNLQENHCSGESLCKWRNACSHSPCGTCLLHTLSVVGEGASLAPVLGCRSK